MQKIYWKYEKQNPGKSLRKPVKNIAKMGKKYTNLMKIYGNNVEKYFKINLKCDKIVENH